MNRPRTPDDPESSDHRQRFAGHSEQAIACSTRNAFLMQTLTNLVCSSRRRSFMLPLSMFAIVVRCHVPEHFTLQFSIDRIFRRDHYHYVTLLRYTVIILPRDDDGRHTLRVHHSRTLKLHSKTPYPGEPQLRRLSETLMIICSSQHHLKSYR